MSRLPRSLRATLRWITPVLVVVEVVLVVTGVLPPAIAVVVFAVVEGLLAVFALGTVIAATRAYRRGVTSRRATRREAAQDALRSVLPASLARFVMIEGCVWWSLYRWRHRPGHNEFRYGKDLRPLVLMVVALVLVEGAVVEFMLGVIFGNRWWLWMLTVLHLYALVWLVGLLASLRVMPHRVTDVDVVMRDSIFGEYRLPLAAVEGVEVRTTANTGRSGLRLDDDGEGRLCQGEGTLVLDLRTGTPVGGIAMPRLAISADEPRRMLAAIEAGRTRVTTRTGRR